MELLQNQFNALSVRIDEVHRVLGERYRELRTYVDGKVQESSNYYQHVQGGMRL